MRRHRKATRDSKRRFSDKTPPLDVVVEHIGAKGDGVAIATLRGKYEEQRRSVFIPLSLPGERVLAKPSFDISEGVACQLTEIIETSPERVEPACSHFGVCGGCGLQHWANAPYAKWKRERVITAIRRAGVDAVEVAPLISAAPGTRRRAEFVMRRLANGRTRANGA